MSNDETLIYVLVSWVYHNFHFQHFDDLKIQFLLIRQRVLLSQWFWICLFGIRNIRKYNLLLIVNPDARVLLHEYQI